MKGASRSLVLALALALTSGAVQAQIALTSDVGLTLTAAPTTNLTPGQPIDFVITVTNNGPDAIPAVEVTSSQWTNEITPISFDQSECYLVVSVLDGATPTYFMSWVISGLPGEPIFQAGEELTCHFSLSVTASAPQSMQFTFGLPSFITDLNPNNDTGIVTLQLAPPVAPAPAPTLSAPAYLLLVGLLAAVAGIADQRFSTASLRSSRAHPNYSLKRTAANRYGKL